MYRNLKSDFELFTSIEYLPSISVVVLLSSKVTRTPGIETPILSTTVPETFSLESCEYTKETEINRNNKNNFFIISGLVFGLFLIIYDIFH